MHTDIFRYINNNLNVFLISFRSVYSVNNLSFIKPSNQPLFFRCFARSETENGAVFYTLKLIMISLYLLICKLEYVEIPKFHI